MWPGRARSDGRVAGSMAVEHGRRAIGGRNAGRRPALRLDRHAEGGLEPRRVLRHHQRNLELVEPLRRHRQTDQTAAVPRHEVDRLRRDLLGRDRQIAFVLPILVVDDDDHAAGANRRRSRPRSGRTDRTLPAAPLAIVRFSFIIAAFSLVAYLDASLPRAGAASARQLRGAHDVLADHVAFEVDAVARPAAPLQIRVLERVRHDLHVEAIRAERRDRQADAVDGDRPLVARCTARAAAES